MTTSLIAKELISLSIENMLTHLVKETSSFYSASDMLEYLLSVSDENYLVDSFLPSDETSATLIGESKSMVILERSNLVDSVVTKSRLLHYVLCKVVDPKMKLEFQACLKPEFTLK